MASTARTVMAFPRLLLVNYDSGGTEYYVEESNLLHSLGIFSRNAETSIPYNRNYHKQKHEREKERQVVSTST